MNNIIEEAKNMPEPVRADFLRNHCTQVQNGQYFKRFDEFDLQQSQAELSDKAIELDRAEEELALAKATHSAKIKKLKSEKRDLLTGLKQNGEWKEGEQFLFADQSRGIMELYDQDGEFVSSRKLLPAERQRKLQDMIADNLGSVSLSKEATV